MRYTARLLAAVSPAGSEARSTFDALQSSVGTSRKAYRLGKFLQHVHGLRSLKRGPGAAGAVLAGLEAVTYAGEGCSYFIDQFMFLIKAGVMPKTHEKALQKVVDRWGFVGDCCGGGPVWCGRWWQANT